MQKFKKSFKVSDTKSFRIAGTQPIRVGCGYDIHRLVRGRKLIIGGVKIPYHKGLLGHSDADCLTHSIIDALLGASKQKDIGRTFGVKRPGYKGIKSLKLLKEVFKKIQKIGWVINNIDSVIICEKPKLAKYIPGMEKNLAKCLEIPLNSISVKATTSKGLGCIGKNEAIASYSIVSIYSN